MENLIYRLEDGRLWDTKNACWLESTPALLSDGEQSSNGELVPGPEITVRDLISSDGVSDETYLAKTLEFYGYPLGELADLSRKGILERLERLDLEYLTPRVLAGLAIGDTYAAGRWNEHERLAAPLREKLAALDGENDGNEREE